LGKIIIQHDFKKQLVIVYLDGTLQSNVTKGVEMFTASSLNPGTEHTISTHTVGTTGLINQTPVSSTVRTAPTPAQTLIVGNVIVKNTGETALVNITLDSAPNGLSGYNITVTVTDPSIAQLL